MTQLSDTFQTNVDTLGKTQAILALRCNPLWFVLYTALVGTEF